MTEREHGEGRGYRACLSVEQADLLDRVAGEILKVPESQRFDLYMVRAGTLSMLPAEAVIGQLADSIDRGGLEGSADRAAVLIEVARQGDKDLRGFASEMSGEEVERSMERTRQLVEHASAELNTRRSLRVLAA